MARSNWQTDTLSNLCDSIDYGFTESAEMLPVGPKFLRITDIVGGFIDWATVPYCRIADKEKEKYKLHHGDIVIARTGATTGYSIYVKNPPDAVFASYLVRYKVKKEFDGHYIAYFLKSSDYWEYIRGVLGDKSAQPNASASTIAQVKVNYPPLSEQQAIVGILGALDDKIELNRRMNATLESMARAVFHQWFVESEETQDWEEKPLDEIADFLNGLALQKFPAEGNEFLPVIKIAQLRKNDTIDADKASMSIPPAYLVQDGDVLFSWSGSLEVVVWCGGKGALNQHLFKVTSDKYPKWFYYSG